MTQFSVLPKAGSQFLQGLSECCCGVQGTTNAEETSLLLLSEYLHMHTHARTTLVLWAPSTLFVSSYHEDSLKKFDGPS
jgi:hypothetical protein